MYKKDSPSFTNYPQNFNRTMQIIELTYEYTIKSVLFIGVAFGAFDFFFWLFWGWMLIMLPFAISNTWSIRFNICPFGETITTVAPRARASSRHLSRAMLSRWSELFNGSSSTIREGFP